MKMVVLKYDGFPTSINKDSTTNGKPHSCNNGTTVNSGLTLPIQTNYLPSSTGEPKMEQPATNNDSLESNDDNNMFVNDPISEATENILTTGAISKIAKGQKEKNLIVQVVHSFQSIEENQFMFISDGLHMQIAILARSLNHLILSGKLKTGSIVQLVEYICPTAHNGMQMIVVSMEVKIFENEFIGEPKLYVEPAPNLDDGKKEHLTKDKDTSFFMHQSHLLGNHQDLYLANKNNTAIRGDVVPLAQPSMSVDATALLGEVEKLQLEINRLHLEKRNEQEKHEGEVLRLKLEMQNEQKKHGDQISQLKSEIVQQHRQTENQIKVMKKELEAVKRMAGNKEEKDADTKRNDEWAHDEYDDELGTNFDKLDQELERIWL
ncbi:hypothetical protein MKW98_014565 [Papaver atlanticum]|uniref:Replication factor-A protein 1 N-terminal domain-containing protein n=1 Tax=Papaver atlanticum TaxID=357466 RepID=A0AAD4XEE8_9MAGN|nr:hypothetical protein MKW98_014565 [Papaver atlanticum]